MPGLSGQTGDGAERSPGLAAIRFRDVHPEEFRSITPAALPIVAPKDRGNSLYVLPGMLRQVGEEEFGQVRQ